MVGLNHAQDLLFQQRNTRVQQSPLRAQEVLQLSEIRGHITTLKNKEDFLGPGGRRMGGSGRSGAGQGGETFQAKEAW